MTQHDDRCPDYEPIADYALIGNCRSAALVSRTGSIDWYCPGAFDAPAVFSRVLDAKKGGYLYMGSPGHAATQRRYVEDTNILQTTFSMGDAEAVVTDLMPVTSGDGGTLTELTGQPTIIRIVEGKRGETPMRLDLRPVANYGLEQAECEEVNNLGLVARCGDAWVGLAGAPELSHNKEDNRWTGEWRLRQGDVHAILLVTGPDRDTVLREMQTKDWQKDLQSTRDFWTHWAAQCNYHGPYRKEVLRSALALKLLTFDPSGAVVAAPTTSLPEELGGERNWDYRFTWLRDSALILYAMLTLGYENEAGKFLTWLRNVIGKHLKDYPQIMYTIEGHPCLPEKTLDALDGYCGSRPVRIGNAASNQTQLDIYGEVLMTAYIHYHRPEGQQEPTASAQLGSRKPDEPTWRVLRALVDDASRVWKEKDNGIWEVRGGPQDFVYSKLMCWAAVDRGIRIAEEHALDADLDRWRKSRDEIRKAIEEHGYNKRVGAFVQAFGSDVLDASVLAIPRIGFLPATDPRVLSTLDQIRQHLVENGQVYRYRAADGLSGGEGAFLLCTFWYIDALALAGRMDEARSLFERTAAFANDVGLLSEEIDPSTGAFLGNFPQGFTHLALIRAAVDLAKIQKHGPEHHAENQGQRVHRAHHAVKEGHG